MERVSIVENAFSGHVIAMVGFEDYILTSCSENGSLMLWELGSLKQLETFEAHNSPVRVLTKFKEFLVTGSQEGTIKVLFLVYVIFSDLETPIFEPKQNS